MNLMLQGFHIAENNEGNIVLFSGLRNILFDPNVLMRDGWVCGIDIFPHMDEFAYANVIPDVHYVRDSDSDDEMSLFGDYKKVKINRKRTSDKKSDSSSSGNG